MARRGGWRHRGRKPHFRYEDARGNPIRDEAALERIDRLVIPPAWKEVWISPNPSAKLQATGVDAAGRHQYVYHPAFRAAQEERKFERLVRFGELLPSLRVQMADHLALGPWREGRTLEGSFAEGGLRIVDGRATKLLSEEKALLSLLRSWRARQARAA